MYESNNEFTYFPDGYEEIEIVFLNCDGKIFLDVVLRNKMIKYPRIRTLKRE